MTNGKKDSSVLSQILIPVTIALLVGGTSPWWWREFIAKDNERFPLPEYPISQPSLPSQPEGENPLLSEPTIRLDWGNTPQYFLTKKIDLQKGYQQAPSQLTFIVEAKGNFSGSLYAYVYDEDGVKICPVDLGTDCFIYEFFINLSTKSNLLDSITSSDPYNYLWQSGEVTRASLTIPYNTKEIRFTFAQKD